MVEKITIIRIRKPLKRDINEELQWFGSSLGLFTQRDKDRSCFRIFIELIKTTKQGKPIASDELAYRLDLTRGTVVHHLNRLKDSGIVEHERKGYILRVDNLSSLIDELQKDIDQISKDMKDIAKDIDKRLSI